MVRHGTRWAIPASLAVIRFASRTTQVAGMRPASVYGTAFSGVIGYHGAQTGAMEGVTTFHQSSDFGVRREARFVRQLVHANVTILVRHVGGHFRRRNERREDCYRIRLVAVRNAVA